ncbi:hypothetical protein BX666DRAFT_668746 [Dichotomocladium elegans]|nr:hypothetical protein BX666DRAFT_668746 [Dichotomocladium elegans]
MACVLIPLLSSSEALPWTFIVQYIAKYFKNERFHRKRRTWLNVPPTPLLFLAWLYLFRHLVRKPTREHKSVTCNENEAQVNKEAQTAIRVKTKVTEADVSDMLGRGRRELKRMLLLIYDPHHRNILWLPQVLISLTRI